MKPIAFKALPAEKYRDLKYDKIVDGLLKAYEIIVSEDYKSVFTNILIEKAKGEIFNETSDIFRVDEIDSLVQYKSEWKWGKHYTSWFYNFWLRRYMEGTMDVSYKILKEIQSHYK